MNKNPDQINNIDEVISNLLNKKEKTILAKCFACARERLVKEGTVASTCVCGEPLFLIKKRREI